MYSFQRRYLLEKKVDDFIQGKETYKIPVNELDVTRVWYTVLVKSNSPLDIEVIIFTRENESVYYRGFSIIETERLLEDSIPLYADLDSIEITVSCSTGADVSLRVKIMYSKIRPYHYWLAILASILSLVSLFFLLVSSYKYIMEREVEKRMKKRRVVELD
ncbi:MAG: hypothetical protein DRJ63_05565 [Thermoprotei archaeon]|nr:MAG: hypothetical protein DRJ63_05565 [Thermoprotei archaeon]